MLEILSVIERCKGQIIFINTDGGAFVVKRNISPDSMLVMSSLESRLGIEVNLKELKTLAIANVKQVISVDPKNAVKSQGFDLGASPRVLQKP